MEEISLITGGSSGIGLEIAKALDHTVIIIAKDQKKLEQVADELSSSKSIIIQPFNLATATAEDYNLLFNSLKEQFGQINHLFLNAATLGNSCPIVNISEQRWFENMQVNLNANFLMVKYLLPLVTDNIIFTQEKELDLAYCSSYNISKYALEKFSELLKAELAEQIKVQDLKLPPIISNLKSKVFQMFPKNYMLASDLTKEIATKLRQLNICKPIYNCSDSA